jgi:hypothetical protein
MCYIVIIIENASKVEHDLQEAREQLQKMNEAAAALRKQYGGMLYS